MGFKAKWYPLNLGSDADSCWSLSVGPDGRIYVAACNERLGGGTVKVLRYNEQEDCLDLLFDLSEEVEDPYDSGRATQCKIHYSFVPSMTDNVLYMATHLSAPPNGKESYSPWGDWHSETAFRGAALLAYDTKADKTLWWDTLFPKEGCRCMCIDEERGLLYALSYPRDHLYVYDIEKRKSTDLGRIGSVNSQVIFIDGRHRIWTTSDYGNLVRYDPDIARLEWSPEPLPHRTEIQDGWHSVLYDVVADPKQPCVYAVGWVTSPHLLRIWPEEGEWGRVEDLGPTNQLSDPHFPISMGLDHCGGLTFAGDGMLYFVGSRWKLLPDDENPAEMTKRFREGVLWRMDPKSCEREEVLTLNRPDGFAHYISRGAVDHNGDLFFGTAFTHAPVGMYKVEMPEDRKRLNAHLPIRRWG